MNHIDDKPIDLPIATNNSGDFVVIYELEHEDGQDFDITDFKAFFAIKKNRLPVDEYLVIYGIGDNLEIFDLTIDDVKRMYIRVNINYSEIPIPQGWYQLLLEYPSGFRRVLIESRYIANVGIIQTTPIE